MTRLVIHVERLILKGVDRADAGAFTRAIRSELAQRLAGPQAASEISAAGQRRRICADQVGRPEALGPAALGRAVAGSIARGVRK
jgi:hypothetical protein